MHFNDSILKIKDILNKNKIGKLYFINTKLVNIYLIGTRGKITENFMLEIKLTVVKNLYLLN